LNGQLAGQVSALLVLTGIGPVFAFADFIVMCTCISGPKKKNKKQTDSSDSTGHHDGKIRV
jgi:hypothetical protein